MIPDDAYLKWKTYLYLTSIPPIYGQSISWEKPTLEPTQYLTKEVLTEEYT